MKTIDMFVMGSHGHLVDPTEGTYLPASQRWNSAIARELK
jgi:hypothetical protein